VETAKGLGIYDIKPLLSVAGGGMTTAVCTDVGELFTFGFGGFTFGNGYPWDAGPRRGSE